MTKCIVPDCDKQRDAGSGIYCPMHRMRLRRYGRLHLIRRKNGTGNINAGGYIDGSINGIRKYEHIRVAEAALGRPLPKGACVHHVNEDRADNRPSNLVICPHDKYHRLLHRRMKARDECGNPDWKQCWICDKYDHPDNLTKRNYHLACARQRYHERKNR